MKCSRLKSCFAICSAWMFISLEIAIYRFSADAANSCKSFAGLPDNFSPYGIRYKLIEGIQKSKGLRTGNKVKVKIGAALLESFCLPTKEKAFLLYSRTRLSTIYRFKTISRLTFLLQNFFLVKYFSFSKFQINKNKFIERAYLDQIFKS